VARVGYVAAQRAVVDVRWEIRGWKLDGRLGEQVIEAVCCVCGFRVEWRQLLSQDNQHGN